MEKAIKIKNIEPITKNQRQINITEDCLVIEIIDQKSKWDTRIKTKINVADNIKVDYVFLLTDKAKKDFIEHRLINLGLASQLNNYYCYFSDKDIKVNAEHRIDSQAKINHQVIFIGDEQQKLNWYEEYKFLYPNGFGRFIIKGLIKDQVKAHYGGHILVNPLAQKVDSHLEMQTVVLGEAAKAVMVPGLKIAANDVKTSHAAKVSNIDDEQLFYLCSRGLTKEQAKSLFIKGIFQEFIDQLPNQELKTKISNLLIKKI